jgi:ubiquinone/menaquinone biosynthesis C-methylase UbiE
VSSSSSAPENAFLLLNEEQSATFDAEYHSRPELDNKFLIFENFFNDRAFTVLDLGGGNGIFIDHMLDRFPLGSATILDSSSLLLNKNRPSDRKELIHGSIEHVSEILRGRTFDCITVNWVLHHLVGNTYRACRENCLKTLIQCRELLKPNGMLIVAENMFDGYVGTNIPSHLIYALTALRRPWCVSLTKRFFNTAGTGVCFQSQGAWQYIFALAGFDVAAFQRGLEWWWLERTFRRKDFRNMAVHLLFVKSVSHGHFFLRPNTVS